MAKPNRQTCVRHHRDPGQVDVPHVPRPQRTRRDPRERKQLERSRRTTTELLKNHVNHLSHSGNMFLVAISDVNGVASVLSSLFAPRTSTDPALLTVVVRRAV